MTPKEQVFDMPNSLNYGSTGRPPGKYLRHSFKKIISNISEFPPPPFDIFFIKSTNNNNNNNNNNYTICCNNGDTLEETAIPAATASVPMLIPKLLTIGP
jgi:hypothetical protein